MSKNQETCYDPENLLARMPWDSIREVAMARHGLSDEQWAVLQKVLPPESSTGRPPHDRRRVIDGILYVLKTGCAWRDLPPEFDK